MKVIFTDSVPSVASRGDVKEVKPGFFRNYLEPYKKALPATESLLKEWEERRKKMLIDKEHIKAKLEETKRRLAGGSVKIEKKVTKKGTLYGSVKPSDIASALKNQLSLEIPQTAIIFSQQMKALGTFEVEVNLGDGVTTMIQVEVIEKK